MNSKPMDLKSKIEALMQEKNISFNELSTHFTISKQTLTQKLNGTRDWTFTEMMVLSKLLGIDDPQGFFFDKNK
jgi:lambda repressor-like predicted transcriptional regulator